MSTEITLYHGTTEERAEALLAGGWRPNAWSRGGQCGQPRFRYLTNHPENARWFAEEKGADVVLEVRVPRDALRMDPEDGVFDTVEEELGFQHGLPGCVVAWTPLSPSAFARHVPEISSSLG